MPEQYWKLTPTETLYILQGHYIRDIQMATLVTAFINVNRDPKKSKAAKPEDISVFGKKEKEEQTPEQQRAILETLTLMMGGTIDG